MHELSIALSLVDVGLEECEKRHVRVEALHLRLGALSGVVREALILSYQMASQGTALQDSKLVILESPGSELELVALEVKDGFSSSIN